MFIVCPACSTRYDVPEGAIGAEGRTVRCAQCPHSWFQPGPEAVSEADTGMAAAAETAAAPPASITPPTLTSITPPAVGNAAIDPPFVEDRYIDPAMDKRASKTWLWLLAAFVLLILAIGGALAWFGAPDWLPLHSTALATSRQGLALDFPPTRIERKTLADGTEFFGARGTVTNTTGISRAVPPIEIVLRDTGKRVVYRWEVVPPKRQLAPGESMTITEAVTDIPKSATVPEIGWKAV